MSKQTDVQEAALHEKPAKSPLRQEPTPESEDTPEAHWERFQTATRKMLTTPKPAKVK